jgi:hypothetical protein
VLEIDQVGFEQSIETNASELNAVPTGQQSLGVLNRSRFGLVGIYPTDLGADCRDDESNDLKRSQCRMEGKLGLTKEARVHIAINISLSLRPCSSQNCADNDRAQNLNGSTSWD